MTIDWTISLGNILTIIVIVGSVYQFVWAIKADVKIVNVELSAMKEQLKKLTEVLIEVGKMGARLDDHSRRLSRLEDKG